MTKSTRKILVYLAIFLPISIITVTLRSIALLINLDSGGIYFENKILMTVAGAITLAAAIFAITFAFDRKNALCPAASFVNPQTYIPSGLAAASLLFVAKDIFAEFLKSREAGGTAKAQSPIIPAVLVITLILCLVCVFNFFLNVFLEKRRSRIRAAFCTSCVAFLAMYAVYLFFSDSLPLNAPNKLIDQLSFIGLSIFFLYETRISLGRPMWKLYISFGLIGANLAFFSSIPSLIYYFVKGTDSSAILSTTIAENILVLVLGAYTVCRLYLTASLVADEPCNAALAIDKMAKLRMDEISARACQEKSESSADEAAQNLEGSNYEIEIPTFMTDEETIPEADTLQADENSEKE